MEYHTFRTGVETLTQLGIMSEYGLKNDADAARMMLADGIDEPIAYRHATFVDHWDRAGRPEVTLDPLLIEVLAQSSLELPGERLPHPDGHEHLLLRLPLDVPHVLTAGQVRAQTLFLSFQPCHRDLGGGTLEPGLVVGLDVGEESPLDPDHFPGLMYPVFTLRAFPLDERPISAVCHEPYFDSFFEGAQITEELLDRCTRVVVGYCFFHSI